MIKKKTYYDLFARIFFIALTGFPVIAISSHAYSAEQNKGENAIQKKYGESLAERADELRKKAEVFASSNQIDKAIDAYKEIIKIYEAENIFCNNGYPTDAAVQIGRLYRYKPEAIQQYRWIMKKCDKKDPYYVFLLAEAEFLATEKKDLQDIYATAVEYEHKSARHEIIQRITLLEQIVSDFPKSKLAPFALYLLGKEYQEILNSTNNPYNKTDTFRGAESAYRAILTVYPKAVFPFDTHHGQKNKLIAPYAQFELANLYKSGVVKRIKKLPKKTRKSATQEAQEDRGDDYIQQAIIEYQEIIKKYPNAKDSYHGRFITNSYLQILYLSTSDNIDTFYTNEKNKFKDLELGKKAALTLLKDFPNEPFVMDGAFGMTHPEALFRLALIEKDIVKSTSLLLQLIEKFGDETTGKEGSDGVGSYGSAAMRELRANDNDAEVNKLIAESCERIRSSKVEKTIKRQKLLLLGSFCENEADESEAPDEDITQNR